MSDNFNATVTRVYDAVAANDITEAVMVGEELLADTMHEWNASPTDDAARRYVAATCCYATALTRMQRQQEAYAACMTALAYTARHNVDPQGLLALCLIVWHILEHTLSNTQPAENSAARDLIAGLTSALGTLIYKYYYATGSACPDDPAMPDAYQALLSITGLVNIDTAPESTLRVIARILDASQSLGLIQ